MFMTFFFPPLPSRRALVRRSRDRGRRVALEALEPRLAAGDVLALFGGLGWTSDLPAPAGDSWGRGSTFHPTLPDPTEADARAPGEALNELRLATRGPQLEGPPQAAIPSHAGPAPAPPEESSWVGARSPVARVRAVIGPDSQGSGWDAFLGVTGGGGFTPAGGPATPPPVVVPPADLPEVLNATRTGEGPPRELSPRRPGTALTFEDRVACQGAVEEVYWRHRTWPAENRAPKPALEAVLPRAAIAAKAEDTLRQSAALAHYWGRPLTGAQLQAEIDRMAGQTQQADRLAELWSAVDNDPQLVAECLARPRLADRLVRNWYASDERVHGGLRARAEAELRQHGTVAAMVRLSGEFVEKMWVKGTEEQALRAQEAAADGREIVLGPQAWEERVAELRAQGVRDVGRLSGLQEDAEQFSVTALLEQSGDRLRVATVAWRKTPFETWLRDARAYVTPSAEGLGEEPAGYDYRLPGLAGPGCVDDTWAPMRAVLDPRYNNTAVWTGTEMIVWGGEQHVGLPYNDGARYDPATDTWTPTSRAGAPAARGNHTAVWTGTDMVIWGNGPSGGRYNPVTDTWRPVTTVGAPSGRAYHRTVWTGTEMIVWGGFPITNTGGRYNPATDTWRPTSLVNAPSPRELHSQVWTGTEMLVWGGFANPGYAPGGARYDPAGDTWAPITRVGEPLLRFSHSTAWTGTEMLVSAGTTNGYPADAGRYNPTTDTWAPMAPDPGINRYNHATVWTGTEMIVWGGQLNRSGARYNPVTDTWVPTSLVGAPLDRRQFPAVWTGTEMILWGGFGIRSPHTAGLDDGARYDPAADTWLPTATFDIPTARSGHAQVWTGAEMIVWGGDVAANMVNGGRYDPATDAWQPIATANAPPNRSGPTAVWTGTEMLVWGGWPDSNTAGGRYNPLTDAWTSMTLAGAPSRRYNHMSVWSGTELLIWGGFPGDLPNGGRYNPVTDTWRPISTLNSPGARSGAAAVWTGREMIIWGGYVYSREQGARYDPVTDTWSPMSTSGQPLTRDFMAAVWTGTEMLVWGGRRVPPGDYFRDGGRYDPATDTWRPTSPIGVPPSRFTTQAVWTGREMIVWGNTVPGSGGRYNPATNTWRAVSTVNQPPSRSQTRLVWTGTEMIVWGGGLTGYSSTGGRYCAVVLDRPSPDAAPPS